MTTGFVSISTASMTLTEPLMFPSKVTVGSATIELFADGTFSGDADAFCTALATVKQDGMATTMPIMWLIANAIRNTNWKGP